MSQPTPLPDDLSLQQIDGAIRGQKAKMFDLRDRLDGIQGEFAQVEGKFKAQFNEVNQLFQKEREVLLALQQKHREITEIKRQKKLQE